MKTWFIKLVHIVGVCIIALPVLAGEWEAEIAFHITNPAGAEFICIPALPDPRDPPGVSPMDCKLYPRAGNTMRLYWNEDLSLTSGELGDS